ncbi:hypothetical protein GmRootV15_31650 [Variovorax sp. V15]
MRETMSASAATLMPASGVAVVWASMENEFRQEVHHAMRAARRLLLAKRHGVILEFTPRT